MRWSRFLFPLMFFFLAIIPAYAQELWQGVSVGMSPNEVQSVQPNTFTPTEPSLHSGGAVERLRSNPFKVRTNTVVAKFFFLNDKLSEVTLAVSEEDIAKKGTQYIFDELSIALSEKYGEPSKKDRTRLGLEALWNISDSVSISLSTNDKFVPFVYIRYRDRKSFSEKL